MDSSATTNVFTKHLETEEELQAPELKLEMVEPTQTILHPPAKSAKKTPVKMSALYDMLAENSSASKKAGKSA